MSTTETDPCDRCERVARRLENEVRKLRYEAAMSGQVKRDRLREYADVLAVAVDIARSAREDGERAN